MTEQPLPHKYDYFLKVLIVGNSGVGKTNLIIRYTDNTFLEWETPTIGVDFKIRTIIVEEKSYKLQLWDTAGSEQFLAITSTFFRNANAVLLVYDTTNLASFEKLDFWLTQIKKNATGHVDYVLAGNKIDAEDKRLVDYQKGSEYALKNNMKFIEVSARTNQNVDEAFELLVKETRGRCPPSNMQHLPSIRLDKDVKEKDDFSCCSGSSKKNNNHVPSSVQKNSDVFKLN